MTQDIVGVGKQHVVDVQDINRNLTEKTLRMRCLAYTHQVKSNLLVETIYDMNNSKKQLASLTGELEQQKKIITHQNKLLKKKNKGLEQDRDLLELKVEERNEAYEKIVHYDSLTGLPNRFLFKDRLKHALTHAERQKRKVALLLLDLDRFQNINDTAGHPIGDEILCSVAQRLLKNTRSCDTIARLGGDEFAIIIEDFGTDELIDSVVEKIQEGFFSPFQIAEMKFYLTASIGISVFPVDTDNADSLLKNADAAMNNAKATGKNKYHFYTEALAIAAHSRFSLENELRKALENDEFEVFYQPQFDLQELNLLGAEALVRWNHPEKGCISPADFIGLAEETGLILDIDVVVLNKACQQALKWINEGRLKGCISVNLSALQFKQKDIVETVKRILSETQLEAKYLEIEITESTLIGQMDKVAKTLDAFKKMGVSLAIDDFGTGYSSLAYLKRFHVDWLKIDRSFVRDVSENPNDAAIVRAIIDMGHALGLSIIAEGVETMEQEKFLRAEGCDAVQGYLYGRPVEASKFGDKQ